MSEIDVTDIQGFALKGYNFPCARYLLLELLQKAAQTFIGQIVQCLTTGERWDGKPVTTVNIAFTFKGLVKLELPEVTLASFPSSFSRA
jgi:hypothetical protein